jgi:hypothetical protein
LRSAKLQTGCKLAENAVIDGRHFPSEELGYEFDRTGLPKNALAGMLSVTKAIVTRLVQGTRKLDPGEAITTRSFFALVPSKIDRPFLQAVRQLIKSDKLAEVAKALVAYPDLESEFGLMIESPVSELRADTIVYACRIGRIDLEHLVRSSRVVKEEDRLKTFDPSVDEVYGKANKGFYLERKRTSPAPRLHSRRASERDAPLLGSRATSASSIQPERLSPILPGTSVDFSLAETCSNWVVMDDSLQPRYRKGEMILAAPATAGFRHGDDVMVETTDQGVKIGQVMFESRDELVIEHPGQGRMSIPRSALLAVNRIAFVVR